MATLNIPQPVSDLQAAWDAITGKAPAYAQLFRYYDAEQALVYASEAMADAFRGQEARWYQNWCAVVVDAVMERLELKGFTISAEGGAGDAQAEGAAAGDLLEGVVAAEELEQEAYDAHLDAMVTGEGFVLAWPGADGGPAEVYRNEPWACHVFYDSERPREKSMGAKLWVGDGRAFMTLYYADHLEHYATKETKQVNGWKAFEPYIEHPDGPTPPNPYGVVPLFHLRRTRRRTIGELAQVRGTQDAINKLFADMMVTGEFQAYPQRWAVTNSDTTQLKNGPNKLWRLPAGDKDEQPVQVGQFSAADLAPYLDAMDKLAASIAATTRTPKHYLVGTQTNISGEALLAQEAPLAKKVGRYATTFGITWRELALFLADAYGKTVDPRALQVVWGDVRTVQPVSQADARLKSVQAGMPLVTTLRRDEAWDDADLAQLAADQAAEATTGSELADALLAKARQGFDQNGNGANAVPQGATTTRA